MNGKEWISIWERVENRNPRSQIIVMSDVQQKHMRTLDAESGVRREAAAVSQFDSAPVDARVLRCDALERESRARRALVGGLRVGLPHTHPRRCHGRANWPPLCGSRTPTNTSPVNSNNEQSAQRSQTRERQ